MNYGWKSATCFKAPKKPVITNGFLVIESDDGKASDYDWLEMGQGIARRYSQFNPSRAVLFTLNLNSKTIGDVGRLTAVQVQELNSLGWDIGSHGEVHAGFSRHSLLADADIGATTLTIEFPYYIFGQYDARPEYTYKIYDGINTDEFTITASNNSQVSGDITITPPLTHAYSTDAKVQMTDASITQLLQGVVDDLAELNIECKGYGYPWHSGSQYGYNPDGVEIVRSINGSGRGVVVPEPNGQSTDPCLLHCRPTAYLLDNIPAIIADISANKRLFVVYGHGEEKGLTPPYYGLDTLIEGAIQAGIKVTTRTRAIAGFFEV